MRHSPGLKGVPATPALTTGLSIRPAGPGDLDALARMMALAIEALQAPYLTPEQVQASRHVMGLDTQLLRDGTYYVVLDGDTVVGSGGWSYRATLFGGDASLVAREPALLDPAHDAARIRAMYTHPAHVRRGIGRAVLAQCEDTAHRHGFTRAEMMATLAGEPLYHACGYRRLGPATDVPVGGVTVPLVRMGKDLTGAD